MLALTGSIFLLPVFIFVAVILMIANKGTPFFYQVRPGKNEKLFKIIKFKTMNDGRDEQGNLLPDSERLTVVGKFIRQTSLDEIPQLMNVLKGNMSLIGPRPLLPEYLDRYSDFQKKRHAVKPGITGWAQVNGRNAISWNKKLEYDVWYVKNISFPLDLKIFWKTFFKVVKSEGINTENMATTTPFVGKSLINIYGASGHAKVIIDIVHSRKEEKILYVFDDDRQKKKILGYEVTNGPSEKLLTGTPTIIGIGNNKIRKRIAQSINGIIPPFLSHATAVISPSAKIGSGTVVMSNAVINVEAVIGRHCIINTSAVIEHEVLLEDFVHVSPNASLAGGVKVGEGTQIGIGASIIPGIKIGKWVTVGAGAVIINNVPDYALVVGNPGRLVRTFSE